MNPHLQKNAMYGKTHSLLIVLGAYIVAGLGAYGAWATFGSLGPLWGILIADIVATLIIFGCGLIFSNSSLYDPYWSVVPPVIAFVWWIEGGRQTEPIHILTLLVVFWWAVRLTRNWAMDWPGLHHEDWRYQRLRAQSGVLYPLVNLGGIHLFPTLIVFAAMIPVHVVMMHEEPANLVITLFAFVIGIGAATLQLVADAQMRRFRQSGAPSFMKEGLWAWSRHPNYLGEILFWVSLWLFAVASVGLTGSAVSGLGALAMIGLFVFYSCPAMDQRTAEKREGYADHIKASSMLLPMPPRAQGEL